jgi:thiamine biosynthesis lipoprotein
VVELTPDRPALAVSAPHGRTAGEGHESWGHVIDPRSGEPTHAARTGLVSGPSSTLCDALSTALLVLGAEGAALVEQRFPGYRAETA